MRLAISITANIFLKSISGAIAVITNIIASTQFKKYYLKHVEEQVDKIKSENPDKTKEQLMMMQSKRRNNANTCYHSNNILRYYIICRFNNNFRRS